MTPNSNGCKGNICNALQKQYGSCNAFINKFKQRAATHFGSGWVWLSLNKQLNLIITDGHDAFNPLRNDSVPILCIDVWDSKPSEYVNNNKMMGCEFQPEDPEFIERE